MICVSAQRGTDTNAGTFAEPLREVAVAIQRSPAGETVVVLDSGDYRQFAVDKSMTIVAEGVLARILPGTGPGDSAVYVGAGLTDVISLRGFTIPGRGGAAGIRFAGARALHVERCSIGGFVGTPEGFPGRGIESFAARGILHVKDTLLRGNQSALEIRDGRAILEGCSIRGMGNDSLGVTIGDSLGVDIGGTAQVTVVGCLVSDHRDMGVYIRGQPGVARPLLTLVNSTITHNRIGIYADRTGQVHLIGSTVTLNDTGLFTLNNGVIYTSGTNSVIGNLSHNIPTGANVAFFKSDITA